MKNITAIWIPGESPCMFHEKEYVLNSRGRKAQEKAKSSGNTYMMNERKHLTKIKTGHYTGGHWEHSS